MPLKGHSRAPLRRTQFRKKDGAMKAHRHPVPTIAMALWFCVFLTLPRSTCPTFPTTESRENTRPVGNFDSFYPAKAAALNEAVQDIGMGRYHTTGAAF